MGTSTVITSGKGGVGKSTLSVGIGRALAARGRRVLLIDCDAGLRSLDRMTGVEAELVFDISDVIHGRCAPIEAIYPCRMEDGTEAEGSEIGGLFLLPAPVSVKETVKPAVMQKLLPLLSKYYDHVLLDSPAGIGTGFRSATTAADRALIVCTSDPVSVRSATSVRKLIEESGIDKADIGLVINRFNGDFFDETAAFDDLDDVIDETGIRLMGVVPEDFPYAAAFLKGKPAPTSAKGMMAARRIASRLEGDMVPIEL